MKKILLVTPDSDNDSAEDDMSHQQKQLLQANLKFEKELLVDREQNINKIEADVKDISQIMNEISTLIHGKLQLLIRQF